jgi:hypothetical protein
MVFSYRQNFEQKFRNGSCDPALTGGSIDNLGGTKQKERVPCGCRCLPSHRRPPFVSALRP